MDRTQQSHSRYKNTIRIEKDIIYKNIKRPVLLYGAYMVIEGEERGYSAENGDEDGEMHSWYLTVGKERK